MVPTEYLDGKTPTEQPNTAFRLQDFFPYRINILANSVSEALAQLYVQRFGLTRHEWRILATLGARTDMTAKEIARDTTLEKMQVSRAVARLESDGLVARDQDHEDRRNKILHLTTKGKSLFQEIVPLVSAREEYILEALSFEERDTLAIIMDKLEIQANELLKRG
ncbi:MAG: MarR family transcriptional regulator [Rhizobiales bacterium]|nr:MarR family transcriptional regulator [Hyphomicrobiales bacterium]